MTKNVVITGTAGFIGSNALDMFIHDPDYRAVAVVDKLSYAADQKRVNKYIVKFYPWDIATINWQYLFKSLDIDIVINFAASSHVDNSNLDDASNEFITSNYLGVAHIVNSVRAYYKATGKKVLIIQVSTDETTGDLPVASSIELDEEAPLHPNNLYSATKAAAEQLLYAMWHTHHDFDYVVVRATNNYGPNQHFEKFLPTIIRSVAEGKKIPVYGKGDNVREWLWVEDFVRGIRAVIDQQEKTGDLVGEVFHFGSGIRKTNIEVVKTVMRLMGCFEDLIEFVPDRPGHDRKYALNCEKAKRMLQWTPQQEFEKGLAIVIADVTARVKRGEKL